MDKAGSMFGTSGIRGDAEKLFTNQFAFDLGRSFVFFLAKLKQSSKVAVGMDPRESSPRIKRAFSSGVISAGGQVFDQGVVPIPAINYILIAEPSLAGSVMISGSHIKARLNGLKFFTLDGEISKKHELLFESIYRKIKQKAAFIDKSQQIISEQKAEEAYKNYLQKWALPKYPAWKVVIDPGNGAQAEVMPWVLSRLGLKIVELNASFQKELLPRDTEVKGDFSDLQNKVRKDKADFGVGYDSDGDRVVFVDEKGQFIPGDYSGALIAKHLETTVVVTPINTSQAVEHIGKSVLRTKVGSPYVVEKMKKFGAGFGFEANGGGIFPEMLSRDGGRMTIELINILVRSKKKLSELVGELPPLFLERDKVEYTWALKDKILKAAEHKFSGKKIERLDGTKIWLDSQTWLLFRSSANAPEFRVFAESNDEQLAKKLLHDGIALVKTIVAENK